MSLKSIEISISPAYVAKIGLIQKAVSDPTAYAKVVEGLIDTGYANALKTCMSLEKSASLTIRWDYVNCLGILGAF